MSSLLTNDSTIIGCEVGLNKLLKKMLEKDVYWTKNKIKEIKLKILRKSEGNFHHNVKKIEAPVKNGFLIKKCACIIFCCFSA